MLWLSNIGKNSRACLRIITGPVKEKRSFYYYDFSQLKINLPKAKGEDDGN